MVSHGQHLAGWLEHEAATPIAAYRRPIQMLAKRAAAAILLGQDVERYAAELASMANQPRDFAEWGDLAAARLLIANTVDDAVARCLALYLSDPDAGSSDAARASFDELALGAALLVGDVAAAQTAHARRLSRRFDRPTVMSAELLFLADEIQRDPAGNALVFSLVRGTYAAIMVGLNRSVAPYVCAFGATARAGLRMRLEGAMRRYDELSFAGEHAPHRLVPERLELPPGAPRIRMIVRSSADELHLDAIEATDLTDDLPDTLQALRRALEPGDRRRFDKLCRSAGTVLEIAIAGAAGLEGEDVLARRIEAALALMRSEGHEIDGVEVLPRQD